MIPKKIHYCWFGNGQMPALAIKCIDSWKKFLPDYELVLWNEGNFDIAANLYVRQAYEKKKFAFVTDYVRLYALYTEGGIYMDTDVEVLKSYDEFLLHSAFSGFETDGNVPTGMMGAEKGSIWAKELLSYYEDKAFIQTDGSLDMTTNTSIITNYMLTKGLKLNNKLQEFSDLVVMYPSEYFCPKDHRTGLLQITKNSYCIHHFAMSWIDPKKKHLTDLKRVLMKIIGVKIVNRFIEIFRLRQIKEMLLK
jgi:mannosyltransferase OCH1-like enzyme